MSDVMTVENAPRDLKSLLSLSGSDRRRLAFKMGLFGGEDEAETAAYDERQISFVTMTNKDQSNTLFGAFAEIDNGKPLTVFKADEATTPKAFKPSTPEPQQTPPPCIDRSREGEAPEDPDAPKPEEAPEPKRPKRKREKAIKNANGKAARMPKEAEDLPQGPEVARTPALPKAMEGFGSNEVQQRLDVLEGMMAKLMLIAEATMLSIYGGFNVVAKQRNSAWLVDKVKEMLAVDGVNRILEKTGGEKKSSGKH